MSSVALEYDINDTIDIIKKLIAIFDLNPNILAKNIGVHHSSILRIIEKQVQKPRDKILRKIADYFSLTLEQIKGQKPIFWENIKGVLDFSTGMRLPFYEWNNSNEWSAVLKHNIPITDITELNVSRNSFFIVINDSIMEPVFPKGASVIVDPEKEPKDGVYVVVKIDNYNKPIIRQIIIDLDKKYLRALNPIIEKDSQIRILNEKDKILGVIVQIKHNLY